MLIAIAGSYVSPTRFSGTVPIVIVSHRHAPIL